MAEVATKKSINVVSSNKHGEVCSVQSNNGLIDLDNITTNNSQIISLCDDDLLLTNNTKNDMNAEDKSLQELIESELALRISTTTDDEEIEVIEDEDTTRTQPEIKKIMLEPRPDPLDINSEFIIAEMDHYNVIDEPSSYQNGHSSPTSKSSKKTESLNIFEDDVEHGQECVFDEEAEVCASQPEVNGTTVTEKTTSNIGQSTQDIHEKDTFGLEESGDFGNKESFGVSDEEGHPKDALANSSHEVYTMDDVVDEHFHDVIPAAKPSPNKYLQEEETNQTKVFEDSVDFIQVESQGQDEEFSEQIGELQKSADLLGTWSNPDSSGDAQQTGQFSDNFDETLQDVETQAELGPETSEDQQQNQIQDSLIPTDLLIQLAPTEAQKNEAEQDAIEIHPQRSLVETEELVTTLPEENIILQREQEILIVAQEQENSEEVGLMDSNAKDISRSDECPEQTVELTESQQHVDLLSEEIEGDLNPSRVIEQEVTSSSSIPNTANTPAPTIQINTQEISSTREFLESERRDVHIDDGKDSREQQEKIEIPVKDHAEQKAEEVTDEELGHEQADDDSSKFEKTVVESTTESSTIINVVGTTDKTVTHETVRIFSESKYADQCFFEAPKPAQDFESWTTVEEATTDQSKVTEETQNVEVTSELKVTDTNRLDEPPKADRQQLAPLATPDDETSDVSNQCDLDSENREEVITTSSVVTSSSASTKTTKTKKKKIEGVASSDASPTQTPRTKKTKKSKKSDPEKENISVNGNLDHSSMRTRSSHTSPERIDLPGEDDLSNVNVKSLTQSYVSEAGRNEEEKSNKEVIATGVSIKQLCRSFGDLSNMSDGEQNAFGQEDHDMDSQERASTMTLEGRRLSRNSVPCGESQSAFSNAKHNLQSTSSYSMKAKSMGDLRLFDQERSELAKDVTVFTGISVKALRASYCSLANLTNVGKEQDYTKSPSKLQKSSFNKFDALSKKTVLHVRSVDAGKVQQQLNSVGQNGDTNPNCRSCGKVVFQMEQTKAEGSIWHKNCFRCVQCSKQLNVDSFQSHEGTLYCKPHFKELFQPKPVEESDQPMRPRKPEMIIRENQPKELPPDVVRASDKPDLGLEELSALNVKSRFQVFEKGSSETNDIERSPSQVAVKRSPSILSKLAKFQAKGMDIGVADESLNGIPYEESSESEEEPDENEDDDNEIIKSKHTTRERPMSFTKMDDIKNRWESTSQQGRRESQREARKEEIAGIRSRLFMGKQGKMKEMYQQAVAESERVTKINAAEEIQHAAHTRSIKERFERGEPIAASDDEGDNKPKPEKPDEEVIAAGISKKSRSLFLELDATAAKTGRPVTPVTPKTPADASRRVRDMDSPEREIYRDPGVVRAEDRVDEVVHTDTARKMLSIFRQMEEKATKEDIPDGPKPLKRFTPPPEDKFAKPTASESEEEDEEEGEESEGEESGEDRDPNYVRASDKVEDEFLKQSQNAARAKTLRAKFERWETTDEKISNHGVAEMEIAQGAGDQSSIESASSLRARFESLGSNSSESPRAPKVKVNRFVEIQTNCMEVCEICEKKVYPLEKVETNNKIFHKQCFRCLQCNCILRMDTFTLNNGKLYCIPHFKQLFITRGNYDEGFGIDPHKNKWASSSSGSPSTALTPTTPSPITVSNGDL